MSDAIFHHRWEPGTTGETLLLLHGTGGDENDLVPLGQQLAPGYNLLSPRGQVLEGGMPRFFRRLAEGVFDEADRVSRARALGEFIREAAAQRGFDLARTTALGYSNGANAAWSLLLEVPGLLRRAVLWRAMMPTAPEPAAPDLTGTSVLLCTGLQDPIVTGAQADRLAAVLTHAGAQVKHERVPAGHGLTARDLSLTHAWLSGDATL